MPVLVEGPDDQGGYRHCSQEDESKEGVEQDQVWAFRFWEVVFASYTMIAIHI